MRIWKRGRKNMVYNILSRFFLGLCTFLVISPIVVAQYDEHDLTGKVTDEHKQALVGASVYWAESNIAVITNERGEFSIPHTHEHTKLVASYIGYSADTLVIQAHEHGFVRFVLKQGVALDVVEIRHKKSSTFSSSLEPMKTHVMTSHELNKAACCNLSDSFETNPSIDVSFTDAVTGTKQIQMLGLAGPYIQISRENMPYIRGLSAIHGLTFAPGPWVEAIHLNKGAGSVVNGFESITGQIDVQYKNPFTMDKLYVNVFANEAGRYEANITAKHAFSEHFATALLVHGKTSFARHDANNEGFMDMPIGNQLIALNRWEYENHEGLHVQFGAKGTWIDTEAGQMDFDKLKNRDTLSPWGLTTTITRADAWSKVGKMFEKKPGFSFGSQYSFTYHNQESIFGTRHYSGSQTSGYANGILQGYIANTNHNFKTGVSVQYDDYKEIFESDNYDRTEIVPGIFGEYSYKYDTKFDAVVGLRADYHSHFGAFATPRVHLRYSPTSAWVFRASGGRGQRVANIFAENNNLLASSRTIEIKSNGTNYAYGLMPEIAWNYGINITRTFRLWYKNGSASIDAYRTQFQNQIVVDFVQDPQKAIFYNLANNSYSNSLQAQIDYELIKQLDIRLAYRWYDVKTAYNGELQAKPLISKHRAFINAGYRTNNDWAFDLTTNWNGSKPLPSLATNPAEYRIAASSPDFITVNAQVTKTWNEVLDIYVGVENALDYKQHDPIIAAAEPYSKYFDSSLIWGPVYGRELYIGLRYSFK